MLGAWSVLPRQDTGEKIPPMGDETLQCLPIKILIYYLMTLQKASHLYTETVCIFWYYIIWYDLKAKDYRTFEKSLYHKREKLSQITKESAENKEAFGIRGNSTLFKNTLKVISSERYFICTVRKICYEKNTQDIVSWDVKSRKSLRIRAKRKRENRKYKQNKR